MKRPFFCTNEDSNIDNDPLHSRPVSKPSYSIMEKLDPHSLRGEMIRF